MIENYFANCEKIKGESQNSLKTKGNDIIQLMKEQMKNDLSDLASRITGSRALIIDQMMTCFIFTDSYGQLSDLLAKLVNQIALEPLKNQAITSVQPLAGDDHINIFMKDFRLIDYKEAIENYRVMNFTANELESKQYKLCYLLNIFIVILDSLKVLAT